MRAGLAVGLVLAGGCAAPEGGAPASVHLCEAPRPQVCTMIYAPVCATLEDGRREDYASPCNACADEAVRAWEEGSCDDDGSAS